MARGGSDRATARARSIPLAPHHAVSSLVRGGSDRATTRARSIPLAPHRPESRLALRGRHQHRKPVRDCAQSQNRSHGEGRVLVQRGAFEACAIQLRLRLRLQLRRRQGRRLHCVAHIHEVTPFA